MTRTLDSTMVPPGDDSDPTRLAQALAAAQHGAALVGPDGNRIPLPDAIIDGLHLLLDAHARGMASTVVPLSLETELTTQQAADYLGVSRPTLVLRLQSGEISFTELEGGHRRVQLADLLDYAKRRRAEAEAALDDMGAEGQEAGLYDATLTPRRIR